MFKTNKPAAENRLSDRLKSISERAAPEVNDYDQAVSAPTRTPRALTFKHAVLTLPHGEKLPVVIKNLSATGARLEFFQNRKLTGVVRIAEAGSGLNRFAKVVWQEEGLLGLSFMED